MLLELLRPGGVGLLITDFVSSETYPELPNVSDSDLPATAARLISERNFFTGVNPMVLHALFRQDPRLAPFVASTALTNPWLWDFGPRTYAVCAVQVVKNA